MKIEKENVFFYGLFYYNIAHVNELRVMRLFETRFCLRQDTVIYRCHLRVF